MAEVATTVAPAGSRRPLPVRRLLRFGIALLPFLVAFSGGVAAFAQDLELRVEASPRPALHAALRDVPRAGGVVGLEARLGVDPGAGLAVRWSDALAGIGNVVVEGDADLRLGDVPAGRASVGARAVLGPVAARLRLDAFGAPPERFAPAGRPSDVPIAAGASVRLAGDGRLDRTWLIAADVAVWHGAAAHGTAGEGDAAWTVDVGASARARALLGRGRDATFAVQTRWGAATAHQALGVGVVHAPRRAPEVAASLWLDRSVNGASVRLLPGAELTGAWRVDGDRWEARVVARPAGRHRAPWSLDLTWRRPWQDATLVLRSGVHAGGVSGEAWQIDVGYERSLDGWGEDVR